MKMAMFHEKDGSLAFVYRHPKLHRLVRDEVSSENLHALLSSLREHSLSDALDSTDSHRFQDWRGRSPSFWPEWREAFKNATDNDSAVKLKLIGIPGAYSAEDRKFLTNEALIEGRKP